MTAEDTRPLPSDPWPNRAALLSPDLGSEPDSPSRPRLDWPDPEPVEVVTQGQDWCEYSDGSVDLYPPRFGRPPDDQPPPIGRNYRNDPLRQARGNLPRPPEVWEAARNDYLAGHSAADVCRRYGLRLGTFRHRAAADGWRRADQPVPDLSQVQADTVAPYDDELDLKAYVDASDSDMAEVCHLRMARAVYQGDGVAARRWHHMSRLLHTEARALDQFIAEAEAWDARHARSDSSDCSDPVFSETGTNADKGSPR